MNDAFDCLKKLRNSIPEDYLPWQADEWIEEIRDSINPWRKIESAPKDGTKIIVNSSNTGFHNFAEVHWGQDRNYKSGWVGYDCEGKYLTQPTHWMRLPNPPEDIK